MQGTWGRAWSLETIAKYLGHTSITTTQRYAHLSPEGIHAQVREMAESWGRTPDGQKRGKDAK